MVEQGLGRHFELTSGPGGLGTSAEAVLPQEIAMRILVADDDPVIALGLAERLQSLGHEAIGPSADGAEAIELARHTEPGLYLFDIDLPSVDGLTAAATLAAAGLRRPTVVVTGIDDPTLIDRAIATGVGAYLTKPVDSGELQAALALAAAPSGARGARSGGRARPAGARGCKLVERAKGLLTTALDLSEQDAFRRPQLTARERNLRLVDVAARIVEQQSLLAPQPP
jgi:two-component system, response regulator PdtaR